MTYVEFICLFYFANGFIVSFLILKSIALMKEEIPDKIGRYFRYFFHILVIYIFYALFQEVQKIESIELKINYGIQEKGSQKEGPHLHDTTGFKSDKGLLYKVHSTKVERR